MVQGQLKYNTQILITRPNSLIGNTANAQTEPELIEDRRRKTVGEDVNVLGRGWHMEDANITSNHSVFDEVEVDLDVLGALMLHRVGRHVY